VGISKPGGRTNEIRFIDGREKESLEGEELVSDDAWIARRAGLTQIRRFWSMSVEMPYHSRKLKVVEPEYTERGEGPSSAEPGTVVLT